MVVGFCTVVIAGGSSGQWADRVMAGSDASVCRSEARGFLVLYALMNLFLPQEMGCLSVSVGDVEGMAMAMESGYIENRRVAM
ncbi:hypothetical protein P167DRAFT_330969 [Morchella conica CCBAS932]|uniref:Uncharacterized protein n=1 Tax=Morchella conica CCBAS932 TaxID=1392247 RepID=A0A3N4KEP3_9PEZI|nr:hypothetical protein P167DRAFT_330969 [Morchella conica CCBAS932]